MVGSHSTFVGSRRLRVVPLIALILHGVTGASAASSERPFSPERVNEAVGHLLGQQEEELRRRWTAMQVEMMGTPNEFMTVTLRDGREINGIVRVIFDDQIVMNTSSSESKVDRGEVRRVTRILRRNTENAAAIGALIGVAVAIPVLYYNVFGERDFTKGQRVGLSFGVGVFVGGPAGGLIGSFAGRGGSQRVIVYEAM